MEKKIKIEIPVIEEKLRITNYYRYTNDENDKFFNVTEKAKFSKREFKSEDVIFSAVKLLKSKKYNNVLRTSVDWLGHAEFGLKHNNKIYNFSLNLAWVHSAYVNRTTKEDIVNKIKTEIGNILFRNYLATQMNKVKKVDDNMLNVSIDLLYLKIFNYFSINRWNKLFDDSSNITEEQKILIYSEEKTEIPLLFNNHTGEIFPNGCKIQLEYLKLYAYSNIFEIKTSKDVIDFKYVVNSKTPYRIKLDDNGFDKTNFLESIGNRVFLDNMKAFNLLYTDTSGNSIVQPYLDKVIKLIQKNEKSHRDKYSLAISFTISYDPQPTIGNVVHEYLKDMSDLKTNKEFLQRKILSDFNSFIAITFKDQNITQYIHKNKFDNYFIQVSTEENKYDFVYSYKDSITDEVFSKVLFSMTEDEYDELFKFLPFYGHEEKYRELKNTFLEQTGKDVTPKK